MPRFSDNISEEGILGENEVLRLFNACKDDYERALVAFAWTTAARPSELLGIHRADVLVQEDSVIIYLATKKLKKTNKFQMKKRHLEFERPQGMDIDPFLEFIADYIKAFKYEDIPVFPYTTTRWMQKVLNKRGMEALGRKITPYHLRHSAITREAQNNASLSGLMHFKGAKSLRSVIPYLHATPYKIMLKRKKKEEFEKFVKNREIPPNSH